MILTVLRALFVLCMAAVGWTFVLDPRWALGSYTWMLLAISLSLAVLMISIDILSPRRKLLVFSGTFLGLLVGVLAAYALSFVVTMLVDYAVSYLNSINPTGAKYITGEQAQSLTNSCQLIVGVISVYLSVSFILQTKDDFRFIVPYVEFRKQTRGPRPIILDTNVLIDGRIVELAESGLIDSELLVPQFVVKELRTLADSGDKLKRNRGKKGQEALQKLHDNTGVVCRIWESTARDDHADDGVDEQLLLLARDLDARIMTSDTPLAQEARIKNLSVININDIAAKLKVSAAPGEKMTVRITKAGESAQQGVGYMPDGTMVVIEDGRAHINTDVEFTVTNTTQTPVGKMIFGRIGGEARPASPRRPRSESSPAT